MLILLLQHCSNKMEVKSHYQFGTSENLGGYNEFKIKIPPALRVLIPQAFQIIRTRTSDGITWTL